MGPRPLDWAGGAMVRSQRRAFLTSSVMHGSAPLSLGPFLCGIPTIDSGICPITWRLRVYRGEPVLLVAADCLKHGRLSCMGEGGV